MTLCTGIQPRKASPLNRARRLAQRESERSGRWPRACVARCKRCGDTWAAPGGLRLGEMIDRHARHCPLASPMTDTIYRGVR